MYPLIIVLLILIILLAILLLILILNRYKFTNPQIYMFLIFLIIISLIGCSIFELCFSFFIR